MSLLQVTLSPSSYVRKEPSNNASDIVLSLPPIADPILVSPRMTTCLRDRNISQIDCDYEFALGLEIADCQAADEGMSDMQHDSDNENIFQTRAQGGRASQDTIPGAGRPLGDLNDYRELNHTMADDHWYPFGSEV